MVEVVHLSWLYELTPLPLTISSIGKELRETWQMCEYYEVGFIEKLFFIALRLLQHFAYLKGWKDGTNNR